MTEDKALIVGRDLSPGARELAEQNGWEEHDRMHPKTAAEYEAQARGEEPKPKKREGRPLRYWRVWVFDYEAATALGERTSQIEASGAFPSRAAFARALTSAGLTRDSERSVSHHIATYGGDGIEVERSSHPDAEPGQVYVSPLTPTSHDKRLPWPPKENND